MNRPIIRRPAGVAASVGLVVALTLAGCGSDETGEPDAAASSPASSASSSASDSAGDTAAPSGTVSAADQDSDGSSLRVDSVELEGVDQGWIAVHSDADGQPGPVVGTAAVQQGSNSDVEVTFDEPVPTGDYWPMLHVDDGEVGTYEFGKVDGVDVPVLDGDAPVMQKITVTVG